MAKSPKTSLLYLNGLLFAIFIIPTEQLSPQIEDETVLDDIRLEDSRDGMSSLRFSAFQRDYNLPLEEAEEIFSPSFRFMQTVQEKGDDGVHFTHHPGIKKESIPGSFYRVADSAGNVYIERTDQGIVAEGIIDDHVRLVPFKDSSDIPILKALRLSSETSFLDINSDYAIPNASNMFTIPEFLQKRPTDIAFIELLVVFDYKNAAALGFDRRAIYRYLGVLWGSVQRLYDVFQKPRIRFTISGVVIVTKPEHEPFLNNLIPNTAQIDGAKVLNQFGLWLFRERSRFPDFDIAILQTRRDLVTASSGHVTSNLLGRAFIASVCQKDEQRKMMWNCGESEDMAPLYSGTLTIAHEIGHLLSASHDGEKTAAKCADLGYIMSAISGGNVQNSYRFSYCSYTAISNYVRSSSPSCIWNNPNIFLKTINEIPTLKPNKVCEVWFGEKSTLYGKIEPKICEKLWCTSTKEGRIHTRGAPPEGTWCGLNMKCVQGRCKKF